MNKFQKMLVVASIAATSRSGWAKHDCPDQIKCDVVSFCLKRAEVCEAGGFQANVTEDKVCVTASGQSFEYKKEATRYFSYSSNEACAEKRIEYLQKEKGCLN